MNIQDDVVVAESALVRRIRKNRYGHVAGLDDEELADPAELERQIFLEEFAPILALPVQRQWNGFRPEVDESGAMDWGAFGTMDFDRISPTFDKTRYKAEKLRERLRRVVIIFSIVKERIPGKAKYQILKYLRMGVIELDHIEDWDMWLLARRYLEARRLREKIARLRETSQWRRDAQHDAWLESR